MRILLSIIMLLQFNALQAQFTGGIDDGYAFSKQINNLSIYIGGNGDGYHHSDLNNLISIYRGGASDGYAKGSYQSAISIYSGGSNDGYAQLSLILDLIPLSLNCPVDPNLECCLDESAIQLAYDEWVNGFSTNDGCLGVSSNIGNIPALPSYAMGAGINLSFSLSAIDDCASVPISCMSTFTVASSTCPTDFDFDGDTDGDDFSIFLGNFGLSCVGCPTDLNSDGMTNGDDFSIFLGNFGLVCN